MNGAKVKLSHALPVEGDVAGLLQVNKVRIPRLHLNDPPRAEKAPFPHPASPVHMSITLQLSSPYVTPLRVPVLEVIDSADAS